MVEESTPAPHRVGPEALHPATENEHGEARRASKRTKRERRRPAEERSLSNWHAPWLAERFHLDNRVKFIEMGLYELARVEQRFDLVWFMGVFYLLRYPLLALDILAAHMRKMMVFQALTLPGDGVHEEIEELGICDREPMTRSDWPKMAFVEHCLAGDPTNWWVANHAGVEAMLRSAGMKAPSRPADEITICQPDSRRENETAERDAWLRAVCGEVNGQI